MGWFKRQYASLEVYWADEQFAKAFARLEMLNRDLTPAQATKLAASLISPDKTKFYVVVSVGGKIGSGRLIGANEGERIICGRSNSTRPAFAARSLTKQRTKNWSSKPA
jgi:hypothetical protein